MSLFHFGGTPTEVAEDPATGRAVSGRRFTLWTAQTGGTQWTTGVADLVGGGVGGTIISAAFGRLLWTVDDPTDTATFVWLQPEGAGGAPGVRWRVLSWEGAAPTAVLPLGGDTRQALVKASPTSGDVAWGTLGPDDVGALPADAMQTHLDAVDPHPQYVRLLGAATGARIWGGNTFPTTADGARDGDYLFYEG